MTLRVLCLVPYPEIAASSRLRVQQYAPHLENLGIHLEIRRFYDEHTYAALHKPGRATQKGVGILRGLTRRVFDIFRATHSDIVLIHREATPMGPAIVELALSRLRIPYVFDFDDALFLQVTHPANRNWAWLRNSRRFETSTRLAREVIAGNLYLADHARRSNSRVTVIPTPVDTDRHLMRLDHTGPGRVIGWIGSATTAPYLKLLDEPLAQLAARRNITLHVVGGHYAHDNIPVEEIRYGIDREASDLEGFDIGVLPEPDDPWTKGKCAHKAILYMATGLPVVASAVGVNPDVVQHGITGFCVRSGAEWSEALELLLDEPELRQTMGEAGRRRVEDRFSVRSQSSKLAAVLLRAAESDSAAAGAPALGDRR